MNDLILNLLRTRVRIPPPPPYRKYVMFKWIKKQKKASPVAKSKREDFEDKIEESLWEIKEEYDLPTEEFDCLVDDKRKNLSYMRKMITLNKN